MTEFNDDYADVIETSGGEGVIDKSLTEFVPWSLREDFGNLRVGDIVGQAVGAEHDAIPRLKTDGKNVRVDGN